MSKLEEIVREKYNRVCNNLLCYSANYFMDTPKKGFEKEFAKTLQEIKDVEEVMEQLGMQRYV